jgi:pimeloyl-ACP methyl ester carboxylesterase
MQTQTAPRVLVVPGAAVRGYVGPAVRELRDRGFDAELLAAPGSPGSPADLVGYGTALADRLRAEDARVDLLIGLSVGAQAAAVAAAASVTAPGAAGEDDVVAAAPQVRRVLLVGPTVDPAVRSTPRLLARWLAGGRVERSGLLREQAPEWRRAGPRRLVELVRSACRVAVEDVLPGIAVPVDVVHAERDLITSHEYAAALAAQAGGRFVIVPDGTHSWPHDDGPRFADLVTETLAGVPR